MNEHLEKEFPFTSKCGKEYLIGFSPFKGVEEYHFELPVINIALEQVNETNDKSNLELCDLKQITNIILDYLSENDVALYYYCDTASIPNRRSKRNESTLPQRYRSRLFGKLFENSDSRNSFVKHDIEIPDPDNGLHLMSLIARQESRKALTSISQQIEDVNDK